MLTQSPYGAQVSVLKNSFRAFSHLAESETFSSLETICNSFASMVFLNQFISVDAVKRFSHI